MDMKQYNVKIDLDEALYYLGYHGEQADEIVEGQLRKSAELLERISAPSYTYRIFDMEKTFQGIELKGSSLILTGESAFSWLRDCRSVIVMAATIGREVDTFIHRCQITDMAEALILDSCASSDVESICDQLEKDLEKEYRKRGLFLTKRFSPGYGDLPLSLQPEICRALSLEKTIGLSITSGMLMMPTKSVTAFIGISDCPQPEKRSGCEDCLMNRSCNYRKAGTACAE